jgi:hypothetical protein
MDVPCRTSWMKWFCLIGCWFIGLTNQTSSLLGADILVGAAVPLGQRKPLDQIDHRVWDELLQRFVNARGLVDYSRWKGDASATQQLDDYLAELSSSDGRGTKQEQLAYWINAYNAVTVRGILREYPTTSIRNHTAKLFGYNIWKNLKLQVGGEQVSLDDMEHKILRKLGEPRIHFAIVCASVGCPILRNEAYTSAKLEEQLESNALAFFKDPTKFAFQATTQKFQVSPILDWFGEDFGDSREAILKRISPWISDPTASELAKRGEGSLGFLEYDWNLNDQK